MLFSEAESFYQLSIALYVVSTEILQEATSMPYQLNKTSPGMVVVDVDFKVFGQFIYPLSE
jgi:hypothetical protein